MPNDKSVEKIQQIEKELNTSFPERKNVIRGILTAILASEHVLLLGPPGTGKSLLARTVSNSLFQSSYYELLLTKFTTPEEVFGPVSFSGLKQDKFNRITEGFAADKKFVLLDEIFKASSAILNTLLTLMNERVFHNGGKPQKTPLEILMGLSNEYPQDDSLKALYDRILVKFWVDYIGDRDSLASLIENGVDSVKTRLTEEDLNSLREKVINFQFTKANINTLLDIKAAIESDGFIASDRTWVKCAKIIKAHAVLNGRDKVNSNDFTILSDVLWKEHKDREKLHSIIGNAADPYGARAESIIDAVKTAMRSLPDISLLQSGQKTKVELTAEIAQISGQVVSRKDALLDVIDEMNGETNDTINEAKQTVQIAIEQIQKLSSEVIMFRAQ